MLYKKVLVLTISLFLILIVFYFVRAFLAADLDSNGKVDINDLLLLFLSWGSTSNDSADMDQNGIVNIFDLLILIKYWGASDLGDDTNSFCSDGTPVGKCNTNPESENFLKYCNENKIFVSDCTQCGCPSDVFSCDKVTKLCKINSSRRCPPYESSCDLNKKLFLSCKESKKLKLKGDIRIGVIVLSQFTREQFPYSYLHLLEGRINDKEKTFFEKEELLKELDYYKLDYIDKWLRSQAKRIIGDSNFISLTFNFLTPEPCYFDKSAISNLSNLQSGGPSVAGGSNHNLDLLSSFLENNCLGKTDVSESDALLVIAFKLDGAKGLKESLVFNTDTDKTSKNIVGFSGEYIKVNGKKMPLIWVEVGTIPPFCEVRKTNKKEDCRFESEKNNLDCFELDCTSEECCYNPSLPKCLNRECRSPAELSLVNAISAHELLHLFGAGDHYYTIKTSAAQYSSCRDLDESTLPFKIKECDNTVCVMTGKIGFTPLRCALLCGKEAREIGWNDNDRNGILEIEE
jgi:hypothetical protein